MSNDKKFKPNLMLDEQMYFDATNTLLYQIREELKENNELLRKQLNKAEQQPAKKIEKDLADSQPAEKVEKKPKKAQASEKEE
jgi:hypothetical protein